MHGHLWDVASLLRIEPVPRTALALGGADVTVRIFYTHNFDTFYRTLLAYAHIHANLHVLYLHGPFCMVGTSFGHP